MKITEVKCFPVFAGSKNYLFVKVETDEGVYGMGEFGISWREQAGIGAIEHLKALLIGEDPLNIEYLWQLMLRGDFFPGGRINTAAISAIDIALWDIKGKALGQPVHMLLGGKLRERVECYTGFGGATPQDTASKGVELVAEGWRFLRLSIPDRDGVMDGSAAVRDAVAHFAALREAVGPDMKLMLDPFHFYDRHDACFIGRELENLDYYWIEEPMDEQSMSSYKWLTDQLTIPVVGPETMEGKHFTRAEWIVQNAADISRAGVGDVGGLTPLMKTIHLCEAHGVRCEIHGGGPANLAALCAMRIPGEFYERGLLHPFVDYDEPPPHLRSIADPLDDEGNVTISDEPGLGWDFDWDWIQAHRVD